MRTTATDAARRGEGDGGDGAYSFFLGRRGGDGGATVSPATSVELAALPWLRTDRGKRSGASGRRWGRRVREKRVGAGAHLVGNRGKRRRARRTPASKIVGPGARFGEEAEGRESGGRGLQIGPERGRLNGLNRPNHASNRRRFSVKAWSAGGRRR